MSDTSDLYTKVKNTSGSARFFGYLGRHGRQLAANAFFSIFGRLESQLGWNERKQSDLETDLIATGGNPPHLTIISTPKSLVADAAAVVIPLPTVTATVAPTGGGASGGVLPAGHYRVGYTFYDGVGETTVGGISADFTVGSTNIPRVTLPAIPAGATGIRIYLSNTSVGATAAGVPLKLWDHITSGTTYDFNGTEWNGGTQTFTAAPAPPTTNTVEGHTVLALGVSNTTPVSVDPSMGITTTPIS